MNSYKNRRSVYWLRTTLVLLSLHRLISWLLRRISYYTSALYVIKYHNIKPTIPCPLFSQNYSMADFKKWLNKGHDCIFIFTTCPLFRFVSSFSLFSHAGPSVLLLSNCLYNIIDTFLRVKVKVLWYLFWLLRFNNLYCNIMTS